MKLYFKTSYVKEKRNYSYNKTIELLNAETTKQSEE